MFRVAACVLGAFAFFATTVMAEHPPEFKKAYRTYTEFLKQGKIGDAIPYAEKALDIALKSDAFDDKTRARLAFNLGYANFQDARSSDAIEAFTRAIELMRKAGKGEDTLVAEALIYRGVCYRFLLDSKKAELDLEQAIKLLDDPAPAVQIVRAEALENLAWVMVQQKRRQAAEEYARDAAAVYSRHFPKNHPRRLRVRLIVSACAWIRGHRIEAADLLASVLADAEHVELAPDGTVPPTDGAQFTVRELAQFHNLVARLYDMMGKESEASHHWSIASDLRKGIQPVSRRVKPIERRPPPYPRGAAQRGKTGWVLVEFTVRKDGSTSDIQIVDSAPRGVFDHVALSTVKKWKYESPTEDGKSVDVPGVRTMIQFLLER